MDDSRKRREYAAKQTELRYEQEFYLLLSRLFAEDKRLPALEMVEAHRASWRVRLAILKLSQGSLEALNLYIKAAERDYSEVLTWAENPPVESAPELKAIISQWLVRQGRDEEAEKILSTD